MLPVFGDGKADEPEEVDEEEGPIDRDKEDLKIGANPAGNGDKKKAFPQIELIDGSEDGTVSFWTPQDRYALFQKHGALGFILVGIRQPRGGVVLDNEVDDIECNDVHKAKVLVFEYAVEDIGIEEGKVAPPFSLPEDWPFHHSLHFPQHLEQFALHWQETAFLNFLHLIWSIILLIPSNAFPTTQPSS